MKRTKKLKIEILNPKFYLSLAVFVCGLIFFLNLKTPNVSAGDATSEIEKAIFTRQEFFSAQAIVPIPTAEARANLAKLAESAPADPRILEKLAEFDEKLAQFDAAEKTLLRLCELDASKRERLAAFYDRRAEFGKEAEILKQILLSAARENRAYYFERLVRFARRHDLPQYLTTEFFAQITKENPEVFAVFRRIILNLSETENYADALKFVREAKAQFPAQKEFLLEKEVEILRELNKPDEAERVYQAAFDPFWENEQAQKFYDFLDNQNRLRAYGAEVKSRFVKNPADFDAAIRLALYRDHDYEYGNDSIAPIILKLEQAKKSWTAAELVTAARLLLRAGESDLAARFLYTLYAREDFRQNGELRAKILYQLFEMFSDAGERRLPLTKGDLSFYEDIAKADTNPGITTGILSLVFSDTSPQAEFDNQESRATAFFNRAAAYRIFQEYKKENPASPELAQMYLDVVRLYTALENKEIAEKTLDEFAASYEQSKDYADAAGKLADAYLVAKREDKARETYQKMLDYLGKQKMFRAAEKFDSDENFESSEENSENQITPERNQQSVFSSPTNTNYNSYDDRSETVFNESLTPKDEEITYADVLEKLVALLAKDKKTAEILALYSNEIQKYPDQEWLYEARLAWLEQTNLTKEKLQLYKLALERFQTRSWQDKLARFFIRERRDDDFAAFSEDLLAKLSDEEAQVYLANFIESKRFGNDFERQLFLKLYMRANERFPHNTAIVVNLLDFYARNQREDDWRRLAAEYYFESKDVRKNFLSRLAEKGVLREYLANANADSSIYALFRADASAQLSDYENAVAAYRKLNELYPNTPEFSERLVSFTRSFGQKNRALLGESAQLAKTQADFLRNSAAHQTTSGEIYAESGDYEKARAEWQKLIATEKGEKEIYLDTATVFWDYFQYDDALATIKVLRDKYNDNTLYAFEAGAIYEAKREKDQAIGEYVKALGADETQKEKAVRRLAVLASRAKENEARIEAVFARRKPSTADYAAIGYADYLIKIKQTEKAEIVLNQAVGNSADTGFLKFAQNFYSWHEFDSGERLVLKKLSETEKTPRRKIGYALELAESFAAANERDAAKNALESLVRAFPTNYGVLSASAKILDENGFETDAAKLLQNALPKSRGFYRTSLAGKLSDILIKSNQLASAERILVELHAANAENTEIFRRLAKVCVHTGNAELMRKAFAETVAELKKTDADKREIDAQIADLRGEMIDVFTRLKDYRSAIEQHIEIINREPENEELTENAIRYVERYGGAETLLNYYLKTSAEAFKNYRWNVVLARIYEANGDAENAAKNYKNALQNQPEMEELYLSLAEIEAKRNNFGAAIENLDEVLKLTNDAPEYVKKKIEILKKAGRFDEIAAEKAKLPAEDEKKIVADEFAEARRLQASEKEKARELFRAALAKMLENPLNEDLSAANVSAYVASLREEETLDRINRNLWQLREKLIEIIDEKDSLNAGEARARRRILETALIESIGKTANERGTDEELKNLHEFFAAKIDEIERYSESNETLPFLQNYCRRVGFGDLEEKILLKKLEETKENSAERETKLRALANFYNERGAYQKTFDALENYAGGDLVFKAEMAKIVGNREKEIEYLREIYRQPAESAIKLSDEDLRRFLDLLYAENRDELKALTERNSVYQLPLINFLLGKGERDLAHAAIQNSAFADAWKAARHAETSLALKEFDERNECYFCAALQFDSIGNLLAQTPDKKSFLINDDWFRLSREYGEWLFEKNDKSVPPAKFLPAMIENYPQNSDEQAKLGVFYLEKSDVKSAVEHLRLAVELAPENAEYWTIVGTAYLKAGKKDYAEKSFEKVFESDAAKNLTVYFQTLEKYGFGDQAREKLLPKLVEFLEKSDVGNDEEMQNLVREIANSSAGEAAKTDFFKEILRRRPTDRSLAEMLLNENLLAKNERGEFFEILISRLGKNYYYDHDYDFGAIAERTFSQADAESVYEQENDYETREPENELIEWQRKYLELLLDARGDARAEQVINQIEADLIGKFARPVWLRAAKINLQIRRGRVDFNEIERFVGISVSDAAAEIIPPSVERLNTVLEVFKTEKRGAESLSLRVSFFARMLALKQFDTANFDGFARVLFEKGETEKALLVLKLLTTETSEAALAELANFTEIKEKAADAAKLAEATAQSFAFQPDSFEIAAAIAFEFKQLDAAIEFRQKLREESPDDFENALALAEILIANGKKTEGFEILHAVVADRDAFRTERWKARNNLLEAGENVEISNEKFDAYAQFYKGFLAPEFSQNHNPAAYFLAALIADQTAQTGAKQELIKIYAKSGKEFSALKLAESDGSAKSDELLQILSETAEKIGDYTKASEYEKSKSAPGAKRIATLENLEKTKNQKATDFTVNAENTRKL